LSLKSVVEKLVGAKRTATWYRWNDIPLEQVNERLSRRLITGDQ